MSEKKWTKEQLQAIKLTGNNILVSAAAGSGKTSVLVERIVNKVVNEKIDIDKILVVTFTNAAASEMRQRLIDELYKKIEEDPNDKGLQRQLLLINKANISTIHSFCLNVIRNNFFEIGISNNFRVANETEIEIIKQEVIEDIFEKQYESENKEFLKLLDSYTSYKDDSNLKNLILKIYEFIQSDPFPEKWLKEAIEDYNINCEDFSKTKWGDLILEKAKETIEDSIINLKQAIKEIMAYSNLKDFINILNIDLAEIQSIDLTSWDNAYKGISSKKWDDWPRKGKLNEEEKQEKERAKAIRDLVKSNFAEVKELIKYDSKEAIEDINEMYNTLKALQKLVEDFNKEFKNIKREKNIVDFNDIEHLALQILIDENGNKTEIAKKYDFNEIEIDEYQDSNSVQEYILNSVSNGNNIFMVGDVKQSIYKFRQANPKLFMEKYNNYILPKENNNENTKILLYKNFRSRKNILDLTNLVFTNIMSEKLGEIEYTQKEALYQGRDFGENNIDNSTELNIIEVMEEDIINDTEEVIENATLEARVIAKRIKELNKENVPYKDMVILLRSPKQIANIYEKELINKNIPVFSDISDKYLDTIEIDTIMSLLKIIDNPLQDIPLVTVLRSAICGFSDNELIKIRLEDKNLPYYKAIEKAKESENIDINLKNKIIKFINLINYFKEEEKKLPLNELIWDIYNKTGYYHYAGLMSNGNLRQANLRKLFEKAKEYEKISFKGLFNFIIFMEKVGANNSDLGAARVISENDDVVRIMSIHKSKGLEFPIVFLGNANKNFNLRDMNEKIILDNSLGVGANYISDGIEFPLLTKEAIKIKAKKEAISEEMRVLYVALTRAKDKIIIVGTDNKVQKKLQEKEEEIKRYHRFDKKDKKDKININLVKKCKSYLEYFELIYKYNENSEINLNIINKSELIESNDKEEKENLNEKKKIIEKIENQKISKEKYEKIDKLLNYEYKYKKDVDLITKTSVTALKDKMEVMKKVPSFAKENKIDNARKGTIIHLILSKITNEKNEEDIFELIKKLQNNNIITQEEKDIIDINIIKNYINSDIFKELLNAKEVQKEIPFYLNIDSKEIYEGTNEKILVQGIIDLYYINKKDELILVDYKTDYVKDKSGLELIEKYKEQLLLYKLALEKALKRKVDYVYIYSTYLNKKIKL